MSLYCETDEYKFTGCAAVLCLKIRILDDMQRSSGRIRRAVLSTKRVPAVGLCAALRRPVVPPSTSRFDSMPLRCVWVEAAERDPLVVLGLKPGASRQQIKARYYELAKLTHPDCRPDEAEDDPAQPTFLEVLAAFEDLMEGGRAGGVGEGGAPRTSANHAARGGSKSDRRTGESQAGLSRRRKTLGEVLCEELEEDAHAIERVWADIKERNLAVHETMIDALFRACGRVHRDSGGGLAAALAILRDATL